MLEIYPLIVLMCTHFVTGGVLNHGQQPQGRIFGATEVDITVAPWTASVHFNYYDEMKLHCGGTIISQKFVATTAVAFLTSWNYEFFVRVGSSSYNEGGQMIKVEEFFCREDARTYDSNVGLFLLSENIQFGPTAYPISLPFKDQPVPYGNKCSITGWGYSDIQGTLTGKIGRLITDIWTDQEKCKISTLNNTYSANIFCAGGIGEENTCLFDAGDPLVVDEVLVGITNYPYGCKEYVSSYLKVSSQIDWIVFIVDKFYYKNHGIFSNNLKDLYTNERPKNSYTEIIQSCNVYSMLEKK